MTNITIRPARPEDNPGIRKVQVSTWKSAYKGMIPDRILDEMTVDSPPRRNSNPSNELMASRLAFVAINDLNDIVGFTVGGLNRSKEHGFESELWAIYVLPNFQGGGIGEKLFSALKGELSKSYKDMIIWVLEANLASHKFYETMGGKRISGSKQFKWNDEPIATEIAYGWESLK